MPELRVKSDERYTRKQLKKPVRRRNKRRLLLLFGICFLLLIGGVAGALAWKVDDAINVISTQTNGASNPSSAALDPTYHADKPLSIVILGRDTRPETGTMLTDVMIVSVLNPKTKQVTMVSIPRDTRVKIPGYSGYEKINAVFATGEAERRRAEANGRVAEEDGPSLTKKTLQELLGIPIEHYVEVDFEGFKAIVDELGGVEVNVDRKLVYDDPTDGTHIHLEPGLQLLNGEQALGYVRHRHDNRGTKYYSSDFDRNRRQQEVIRAMVDKVTSFNGMTKIFSLIDVGAEHVKTDLSPEQIKGLAADFIKINSSAITTLDNGAYWKSGYTYLPKEKLAEIRNTLQAQMELSPEMIAQLNEKVVDESLGVETASSERTVKKKKTTSEAAAPPAQSAKPPAAPPAPAKQDQQQTPPEQPAQETPPPDIVPPEQSGTDNSQLPAPGTEPAPAPEADGEATPPPDIVEQVPPAAGEQPPVTGASGG
ncbi:LCP family protein [Brevibacillus sp. SYP-B805]|uniref:LCP family glycopolymer transferase n=1 Tax=Brevibacillus sp. SYP-B805 TaxID=1578199 RepID=UPI0013EA1D85|nr:LCP family protein [Brevibacillus sp. SYP-B805]NGQ95374.1 LCP family protein [Brevibacillus sp. SYP-B805]